jgi:hypothetical protein
VPGDTQVQETDGRLAIGITEPNPNFVRPRGAGGAGGPFARWRDAFDRLRPAYYRLVLDWPSLQPEEDAPARPRGAQRRLHAHHPAVRELDGRARTAARHRRAPEGSADAGPRRRQRDAGLGRPPRRGL